MICKECKRTIADNSVFCEYCGKKVVTDTHDDVKHKNPKSMKTVLAAVVLIAAICAVSAYLSNRASLTYDYSEDNENDWYGGAAYDENDDYMIQTPKVDKAVNTNGIYYKIDGTTLVISGSGDVDKEAVDGFSKKNFDSILFEYGTINIPDDTFSGYSNVTEVELKNVVAKIGARAFRGCGMQKMLIGSSVEQIGEDAFADCVISDVFVNNEKIRKNLNNRTDFGRLFENASKIHIYYDYTMISDIFKNIDSWDEYWGDYLEFTDKCEKIKSIATQRGKTMGAIDYNLSMERNWGDFYLFEYKTGLRAEKEFVPKKYDAETNTIDYM